MRFVSPARAAATIVLLAAVALVALYVIPSNSYYVFVPDRAHALAPLVKVAGHRANGDSGGVYFVDVRFRKARLLEALLKRPLASGASLQPAAAVLGGATEKQQRKIDLNQMEQSQETAAAVALRRLGYHVKVRLPRVVISAVERNAPAATALRPRDRLLAVDENGCDRTFAVDADAYAGTFPRRNSTISLVGAPGVNTSATPRSLSSRASSAGIVPPTTTRTSSTSFSRRPSRMRGTSVMCAPERIEIPTASASSWIAVSTICSGVWWSPV